MEKTKTKTKEWEKSSKKTVWESAEAVWRVLVCLKWEWLVSALTAGGVITFHNKLDY